MDCGEIVDGADAAGVDTRNGTVCSEEFNEGLIDAGLFAFNIYRMNEKFGGIVAHFVEGVAIDEGLRKRLPAVGDDMISAVFDATAQIDNDVFFSYFTDELVEFYVVDLPVGEEPGGYDDFIGAGLKPCGCVFGVDASADLKAAWPGGESFAGGVVVAGTEFDDVSAGELVGGVGFCKPCGRVDCSKIGLGFVPITEGAANDLFDGAIMQIYTGSKLHMSMVA